MQRQRISLNDYQYICEYYKNGTDFIDEDYGDEFVILRNFEIYNNVVYDKDIFFIPKSIYNIIEKNKSTKNIVYPIYTNNILKFSNLGELYNNYNLSSIADFKYDIKKDNYDKCNIKCDKLRIYNPTIQKNLDFIIYVDNFINDIHFHYLCNLNDNYEKCYEKEFSFNNNKYIEFIEIKIPNIEYLFNETNNIYFEDDFNIIERSDSIKSYYNSNESEDLLNESNINKLYFSLLIRPYIIDKTIENEKEKMKKVYMLSDDYNYNNNFINTSLNITLYPYLEIIDNIYNVNNDIMPSSAIINDEFYFKLSSKLGFENGIISLINEFIYPSKIIKTDNEYNENFDDKQVTKYYNKFFIEESKDYYEREDILEELDFPEIRTTGYVIQIATDIDFKEIVYESKINTDNTTDNFIYDFSFSLNNMFSSWNQLNEILVIRAEFIDKTINNIIRGNPVIITKEWFKYLINDISNSIVIYNNQNNLKRENFMDVNQGFNLIDHIECNIIDNSKQDIAFNKESSLATKILYKPIFYKVNDLQNIRIRKGVRQNIGINLGNFLTKVNVFILNIDSENFKEISRNDMYVIFSIDENKLLEESGTYNILNEDFEYISSGNYTVY